MFALREVQGNTDLLLQRHAAFKNLLKAWFLDLESFEFAQRDADGRLRSLLENQRWTAWKEDGPLGKIHTRILWKALGEHVTGAHGAKSYVRTGGMALAPEDLKRIADDLEELMNKWRQVSRERAAGGRETQELTILFCADFWKDPFFEIETYFKSK